MKKYVDTSQMCDVWIKRYNRKYGKRKVTYETAARAVVRSRYSRYDREDALQYIFERRNNFSSYTMAKKILYSKTPMKDLNKVLKMSRNQMHDYAYGSDATYGMWNDI